MGNFGTTEGNYYNYLDISLYVAVWLNHFIAPFLKYDLLLRNYNGRE